MKVTAVMRTCVIRAITLGASFIIALSVLVIAAPSATQRPVSSGRASQTEQSRGVQLSVSSAELPLSFEPNLGQTEPQVKFLSRGNRYKLFLTANEAVLLLEKFGANPEIRDPKLGVRQPDDLTPHSSILARNFSPASEQEQPWDQAVLAMRLVGANRKSAVTGLAEFPGTSNYFVGNDPTNWHTHIPNYGKVRYENIYPGIDLVYYGNQSHLEYDFVVAPGMDPDRIGLAFEARSQPQHKLRRPRLDENGDLVINVKGREIRFRKPFVYQPTSEPGGKTPVEARYVLRANHQIGFELGQYDRSKLLVIDPVLLYSTYLGGSGYDQGFGVAVDGSGNILVAGTTASTNFPTANPFQSQNAGQQDVFITKFNPSGTTLIYSTYLGGKNNEFCEGLALDSSGDAYVTGYTNSPNFPQKNPIQGKKGVQNIFLSKFDPTGNLLASTYSGGSGDDEAFGIAVDSSGVYVVGNTTSTNYPTKNAFQPLIASADDAFLTKFTTDGASVVYSTYLGGAGGGSQAYAVAVDSSLSPYVTGQTNSHSFPLMNPFQSQNGAQGDVFVTKFTPTGNALVYSTYLGGTSTQSAGGIAVDASGNAYVSGGTGSVDFPLQNPLQAKIAGMYDVFVTKFNSSGSALLYSTYIGGSNNEFGGAITLDSLGNAYVSGYVLSTNFPTTPNAFQPASGGNWDGFVLALNSTGTGLIYSSYLGGSGLDVADAMTIDSSGNIYVTGAAASTNFPITNNAFQSTNAGGSDDAYLNVVSAVTTFPLTVSVTGTGTGTVTSSPMGINCGTVCSTTFAAGTVALTATAGAGSTFTGWSGPCSGTGVCNITMNAPQSVTATFAPPVFSVLYNLGGNSGDPAFPTWPGIIAQGRDGNLYSTTPLAQGGSNGAVFNVTPSGTVTVLTTFASGGAPQSGLTLGTDGNFYGTTFGCSVGGDGTIFSVTAGGTPGPLSYTFTGGTDGKCPTAPPIQSGIDGNFYGTATSSNTSGLYGSVYKITTAGKFTKLHDFVNTDGAVPAAPLMQASSGIFYGVTQAGGSIGGNAGEVFSITSSGGFNALAAFNGNNGHASVAPLVQGNDGNFYGTAIQGGTSNLGVVFKVTPKGAITDIYNFTGNGDGAYPYGGLVMASDGNFYGTTSQATASSGCGTIFRISNGNFGNLFTFPSDGSFGLQSPGHVSSAHKRDTIRRYGFRRKYHRRCLPRWLRRVFQLECQPAAVHPTAADLR